LFVNFVITILFVIFVEGSTHAVSPPNLSPPNLSPFLYSSLYTQLSQTRNILPKQNFSKGKSMRDISSCHPTRRVCMYTHTLTYSELLGTVTLGLFISPLRYVREKEMEEGSESEGGRDSQRYQKPECRHRHRGWKRLVHQGVGERASERVRVNARTRE
jgi:hypothetical protein